MCLRRMDSDWGLFFKNIKNISERPTSGIGSIEAGEIAIEGGDAITITLGDTTAAFRSALCIGRMPCSRGD
mgnify:CR=1 FL=1